MKDTTETAKIANLTKVKEKGDSREPSASDVHVGKLFKIQG